MSLFWTAQCWQIFQSDRGNLMLSVLIGLAVDWQWSHEKIVTFWLLSSMDRTDLTKTPEIWGSKLFLCSCHCVCWHLYSKLLAVLCTFCWWLSMILDGVMWDFMARKLTLQTWTSWLLKESFWITTMYNRFVLRLEVLFSPADIQYTQVCCQPFFQHIVFFIIQDLICMEISRAPNFYWINVYMFRYYEFCELYCTMSHSEINVLFRPWIGVSHNAPINVKRLGGDRA